MAKTIKEINEKIKRGEVVVVTAEEVIGLVEKNGLAETAKKVDVVTTGTFGPMCSSGAYFNIGHSKPRIKIGGGTCTINDVPAYTGFAAVDIYMGATAIPDDDPRNKVYPGEFKYGGGSCDWIHKKRCRGRHAYASWAFRKAIVHRGNSISHLFSVHCDICDHVERAWIQRSA